MQPHYYINFADVCVQSDFRLLQGAQEHLNIIFHKVINHTEWLESEDLLLSNSNK